MSDLFDTLENADFEELAFALKDYAKSLRQMAQRLAESEYEQSLMERGIDTPLAAKEAAKAAEALSNQLFHLHILLDK